MTLEALRLLPRGDAGWGTSALTFGKRTTLLLGPNGAGKTPVIKALAYCLGHPVELPPLVREKCRAVEVTLLAEGERFRIQRQFVTGVEVSVTKASGETLSFRDERAVSEWILPRLGVSLRTLAGKSGEKVAPYMSVAGPMFLVDQDTGWTTSYVPFESHQFVKDQREEVVRWLLDVPARNRPVDKSEFQGAKTTLASIQEQIAFKRRALEGLQRELGEDRANDAAQRLEERRVSLDGELHRAHSILASMSQVESAFDVRLREAVERRDQIAYRLANAKRRKAQLGDVQAEVGAELGALEQNEVAAEAFRALCGNDACQFFRKPEESYGRRVLYLKDQLKDFESSSGEIEREFVLFQEQLAAADGAVQQAVKEKESSLKPTVSGFAIAAVEATSRELADVRVRLDRLERIARERRQLEALINKEARAAEDVAELRPTGGPRRDNSRLLDARQNLAVTFKEWLLALRTPNVPADVVFDEELRLIVSGERFSSRSSHSGSTRTRLVLAYHAAMVETSLAMKGVHPRLLVLDAPRQHELSAADLRSFIERFYAMSTKHDPAVQLVFSATDPEVMPADRVDVVWKAPFVFDGEPRFLGPAPVA
jgi:hypothetical protein